MPGRIHLLIGGHLSTAPRAQKEALALLAAGYEVEVTGIWHDEAAAAQDEALMNRTGIHFTPALDFRGGAPRAELRRIRVRLEARWARKRFRRTRHFSPRLLGYGAPELFHQAQSKAADLTIAHSEAGLWAAWKLAQQGCGVGVDFEDWFSRDLPHEARYERPVRQLEELECAVAGAARYVVCPSHAMAQALAKAYTIPSPGVVYNAFPWAERANLDGLLLDRRDRQIPSLHWFSQIIGPHRGLELLLAALPLLKTRVTLHLRGACSRAVQTRLLHPLPPALHNSVVFLPLVSSAELPSRIAEHDIGFALESAEITSRDLTVSNKLFQYLQGGLAVIATDTKGQREVLSRCGEAGILLADSLPSTLARAIDSLLENPARLARCRRAALAAAQGPFAWESLQSQIVCQVERAFTIRA